MSKMFQLYGVGQALFPVLPPPIHFQNAPTSNQTNYEIGQVVYTGTVGAYSFYIYAGAGTWELLDVSTGVLDTLTTDDSTVVVPVGGNINLKGAGSTTTVGSGANATVELTGLTNHAVLVGAGTTTITKVGPSATAGQIFQSAGAAADPAFSTATYPSTATSTGTILRANGTNWVASTATYPTTAVAGDLLYASATNVISGLADVATGQVLVSGGVGVAPAYSATPTVTSLSTTTTVTAGTSITATAGNITATLGNVVINGAAKQLQVHGGAATDFIGQATLVNGAATIANTNIAATDRIFVSRSAKNTSTAYGVFQVVITPATNFIITACKSDTTTETGDLSTVDYFIVRQV